MARASTAAPLLALAAAAALLAAARPTAADATAFAMHYAARGGRGGPCGGLGEACCAELSCKGADMACLSAVCTACGDDGQPACAGGKCEDGLTAVDNVGPVPICAGAPRGAPGVPLPAVSPDEKDEKARKRASDAGLILSGACKSDKDCRGRNACISGVCTPCGGVGQACCPRGKACKEFGGKVKCMQSEVLKSMVCTAKTD